MFDFDIRDLFPKFILWDQNGFALAKAIEAGLRYFLQKCEQGRDCVLNPDKMPEWRLDELAWEFNILYDYDADVETKCGWIKNARDFYAIYGTAAGIVKYLEAAFDTASVEEWWEYGGEPYHFKVNATGEWSEEAEAWARKSISAVKNLRSVLDTITFNTGDASAGLTTLAAVYGAEITEDIKAT